MDIGTKNVIFKIFIIVVVLIAAYFSYLEIRRLMVARKVEQKMEKAEEKIGEIAGLMQGDDTEGSY